MFYCSLVIKKKLGQETDISCYSITSRMTVDNAFNQMRNFTVDCCSTRLFTAATILTVTVSQLWKKNFYRSGNKFLIDALANQDNDKKGLHNP